jgi:hypothetical protein
MRLNNERLVCSLVTLADIVVAVVAVVAVIHFKLQKMLSIFILLKPFALQYNTIQYPTCLCVNISRIGRIGRIGRLIIGLNIHR